MSSLSDKKLRDISRRNRYGSSSGSVTSSVVDDDGDVDNGNDGGGGGGSGGGGSSYRDREIVVVATKTTISTTRTNNEGDDGSGGNKRYWSGSLNAILGFSSIAVADALYIKRNLLCVHKTPHTNAELHKMQEKRREARDPYLIT